MARWRIRSSWLPVLVVVAVAVKAAFAAGGAPTTGQIDTFDTLSAPGPPMFTLLEPDWLLPPIESLEADTILDSGAERADQMLRNDTATVPSASSRPGSGPLSYSLSDDVTADLRYRRTLLFEQASSQTVRQQSSTDFSTRADRDVVDLNMSWRLAGSTLGVGYQLESARTGGPNDLGLGRFLPGNQQAVHSLTLGLSRAWGASEPPRRIDPLPPEPPAEVAAAAASPTPAP